MRTSPLYPIFLLSLSILATAWPWPKWMPEIDALVVRQNNNGNVASTTTAKATGSPSTSSPQNSAATTTASNSASTKQTGSVKQTSTSTHHYTTSYDAGLPAGGVSLMTPAISSGAQYFKIGDYVTFGWNYTNLLAPPTAVNILATCTANSQLYTIAANQTVVANSTGAVTWDTSAYQSSALSDPLLTNTYTLIIYDAASSISANAQPGYLAVYDQYTFGMYSPQPYVPLSEFQCATCSGALGEMEKRALGLVFAMSIITVLSFTWFVGGLGVIW